MNRPCRSISPSRAGAPTSRAVATCVVLVASLAAAFTYAAPAAAYQAPRDAETPTAPPSDAQAVVAAAVEAFGGADAIRALTSYRLEGAIVTAMGGEHGRIYRIAECPADLAVLVDYGSRSEIRVIAGGESFRGSAVDDMVPVQGPLADAMALQATRSCLPHMLVERGDEAVLAEERDGMSILAFDLGPGLGLRMFVSDETGRVLRSEATMSSTMGAIEFAADYDDYRRVAGVMLPFREETFASGTHTASITVDVLEPNPTGDRAKLPTPGGR